MKSKVLLLTLLVVAVVFMTGCGGKKLVCSMEQEQSFSGLGVKMSSEISFGLSKDDVVESATADIKVEIDKDSYSELEKAGSAKTTMEYFATQMESSFTASMPSDAVKTSTKVNKNVVTVTADIDVTKAGETKTKDEAIEYYESLGYKCK